jgi:hypothetical protein
MRLRFFAAAVVLGLPLAARAQTAPLPSIDARTYRASVDPSGGLVYEPVGTQGHLVWNLGASFAYTHAPVSLKRAGTGAVAFRPVEAAFTSDLVLGLGLSKRASFGLAVPIAIVQGGSSGLPATVHTAGQVPTTALGDMSLQAKATLRPNDDGGFGMALATVFTLPTGDRESFMGEGALTGQARITADYSFVVANVQASLGYFFRTEERIWPAATAGGVPFGGQLPYSFSIALKPGIVRALDPKDRQRWELGVRGWLPLHPVAPFGGEGAAALSPVLLSIADRFAFDRKRDAYLLAGIDIGLSQAVGVPTFRGVLSVGWAPREHDQDRDGVDDEVDQCPQIPEDRDGFEDDDGCPEVDDDDDGIPDGEDACPRVKGFASKDRSKNGCPSADADGDGVPDDLDACPGLAGVAAADPRSNGCPTTDSDGDRIPDHIDRCPQQPEDVDGFEDEDGCPDPDDDKDGIPDAEDACPRTPGAPSSLRTSNGCPDEDRDGDTIRNDVDECPDAAEVFNGVRDEDGCPDEGGKPLVVNDSRDPLKPMLRFAAPLKFAGAADAPEVAPQSVPVLRALALALHDHPDWTAVVGVRPQGAGPDATAVALGRAIVLVDWLAKHVRRERVAETVAWEAVRAQPGAEASGVGVVVFVEPPAPSAPDPSQKAPASLDKKPVPALGEKAPAARDKKAAPAGDKKPAGGAHP